MIVGIVIGAGIFRSPSIVAGNAASISAVYLAWVLGGVMSFLGAIVYAELGTTYPHAGGDYYYLRRAFGDKLAFLFGWARMSVIQPGAIAAVAFIFGDYASQLLSLGGYSSAIYAALSVAVLTGLNIRGVQLGTGTQNLLTVVLIAGMILVIFAPFVTGPAADTTAAGGPPATSSFGFMMLFVLFTYGGWNEAAYVTGELQNVRRTLAPVLMISIAVITVLYLLMNWAYIQALGLSGVAGSQQVAADLMQRAFGGFGALAISITVCCAALSTANATVFTGGRSSYAFGGDFRQFGFLGKWSAQTGTPANGLLVQGAIALGLVVLGVFTRQGFQTIVEYTAPVFWSFFLITGIAFFVLRSKDARVDRPFRVPLYPIPPLLFCIMCAYLLYSSLDYAGVGSLLGVAVLAVGGLLLLFVHPSMSDTKQ